MPCGIGTLGSAVPPANLARQDVQRAPQRVDVHDIRAPHQRIDPGDAAAADDGKRLQPGEERGRRKLPEALRRLRCRCRNRASRRSPSDGRGGRPRRRGFPPPPAAAGPRMHVGNDV